MPAINFLPFKINPQDKLRSGFRAKYNLAVDKLIKDAQATETGLKLITHDNTELEVDLTEYFYDKATIDDLVFISYATEEDAGTIRIGTIEEVFAGEDDLTVVTPYKLSLLLAQFNGRAIIAGEDLEYGDMICLVPTIEYAIPGDETSERTIVETKAYKAIATDKETLCDGYVEEGGIAGDEVFVKFSGAINPGLTGLIPHKYYYLSGDEAGKITDVAPVGGLRQVVGYAISEFELMMELNDAEVESFVPFLEELPEFIFTVGIESTQELLLTEFRPEGNEDEYSYRFIALPDWISDHTVIFDNISLTGLPEEEGEFRSQLEVVNEAGQKYIADLIIRAIPAVVIKATLIDGNTGEEIGPLPGAYENPGKTNILISVEGLHDGYKLILIGGGSNGSNLNIQFAENVLETEVAEYLADPDTGGYTTLPGVYNLSFATFRGGLDAGIVDIPFLLYDDTYLSKSSFEFWDATNNIKLADISADGSSVFPMPDGGFDVKIIVEETNHDQLNAEVSLEEENVYSNVFYNDPPSNGNEYFLFGESYDGELGGKYSLEILTTLNGNATYNRTISFEVLDEEVKPEGGLILTSVTPNTANNTEIAVLPIKGFEDELPVDWNVLSKYKGAEFDFEEWQHYRRSGNAFVEFESFQYTGKPQFNTYKKPIKESTVSIFRNKGSVDIGNIHGAPSQFRVVVTRRIGGASGDIIDIQSADFSFREILSVQDYSGIKLLDIKSGVFSVRDENMPKEGREYLYPESPSIWSACVRSFNQVQFNKVKIYLDKYINGSWVKLHWQGSDYVSVYNSPKLIKELDSDTKAYVVGLGTAGSRYLYDSSQNHVLIDEPGRYRVKFVAYNTYIIVASRQSDFTLTDPEEKIPIKSCCEVSAGGGGGGGNAGDGLSAELIDEETYLNVNVDNVSIEIFQPNNPLNNYLRVKDKGITTSKLADLSGRSVLGNVSNGAGPVVGVSVITDLLQATDVNLPTSSAVKTYVDTAVSGFINGTANAIPKFGTSSTLVDSILRENASNIYVEGGLFVGTSASEKVSFGSNATNSYLFFRDVAGTNVRYNLDSNSTRLLFAANATEVFRINNATQDATFIKPINIPSAAAPLNVTSTLLVTNFNADYLDSQHGSYYLNRTNHTGTQLAATISDFSAAVRLVTLTGITFTSSAVTATDTVLSALGKLQAQINAGATGVGGSGTAGSITKWVTSATIGNSIMSETGSVVSVAGQLTINRGAGGVDQIYQEWTPTNYGTGVYRMYLYRTSANNLFQFVVGDGSNTGNIDFVVNNLMYNGLTIATRSWANSQFALINHTHAVATTSTAGFMSAADKTKLDGLGSSSLTGSGTIGFHAKFTAANTIGNSIVSESGTDVSVAGAVAIKRGASTTSYIYQEFTPTDYGTGKHRMYIYRASTNVYQFISSDGSTNGDIDFVAGNLTYNGLTIATRSWSNGQFSLLGHTHTASQITNFTSAVRASFSAGSGISYDSSTGVISATGGGGTLTGSGTNGTFAMWTGSTVLGNSTITDNGTEINFNNQRMFGVEGGGAFRSYLHVHNYLSIGKATQHGSLVIHNQATAVPDASCAIQVLSTTRGIGFPVMTRAQRIAIVNPIPGLVVYQSDASGSSVAGLKLFLFNQWVHQSWSIADA